MLKVLLVFVFIFCSQVLWSQTDSTVLTPKRTDQKVEKPPVVKMYKTHPKWEIPVSIVLISAASLGYKEMDKVASLTQEQVLALDPATINSLDRPAAFYDPATFKTNQSKSDIMMTVFVATPLFLVFDKKIKHDWADMLGMLLVAHAVDNTVFFTTLLFVRRPRPLTYNPMLLLDQKTGVGKSNSFYSGHVSWTATSTFFIAKVYTDYHHIKGLKRILIYTGAALPPTLIGYYRIHAGSHFETDAIVGLVTGAACGILVPEIHRIKKKNISLSVRPFSRLGASGITLSHVIK